MSTDIKIGQLPVEHLEHNIELVAIRLADDMIKDSMKGGMGIASALPGDVLKVFYPQINATGRDLHTKIWDKAEKLLREFANKQKIERPLTSLNGYRKKLAVKPDIENP